MNINTARILFAVAYVVVDLVHIMFSFDVYDNAVKRVQGSPMKTTPSAFGIFVMISAFACMAIGWYVLASGTTMTWINNKTNPMNPVVAGALVGFVYGLATIGMFNFTVHTMFNNYDWSIMARDMLWGIGWPTILTTIFAIYYSNR